MKGRRTPTHHSSKKAKTEPRKANAVQQAADAEPEKPTVPTVITTAPVDQTPEAQDGATHTQEQTTKLYKSRWTDTRWQTVFTGFIFVATAVYAVATIFQLKALNKTIDEARISRELENRAWLVSKGPAFTVPLLNVPLMKIPIIMENGGSTPALHARFRAADALFMSEPDNLDFSRVNTPSGKYNIAAHATSASQYVFPPFSSEQKLKLTQQGYKLYMWGVIEYEDVFNHTHETKFCFVVPSIERTEVNACLNPKYNTID